MPRSMLLTTRLKCPRQLEPEISCVQQSAREGVSSSAYAYKVVSKETERVREIERERTGANPNEKQGKNKTEQNRPGRGGKARG